MATIAGVPKNGPWTTEDELEFIRNLGTYSEQGRRHDPWRLVMNYRTVLLTRDNCPFDKDEAVRAINLRLSGL